MDVRRVIKKARLIAKLNGGWVCAQCHGIPTSYREDVGPEGRGAVVLNTILFSDTRYRPRNRSMCGTCGAGLYYLG